MEIKTYILNCFLLLLPVFIWNMIFSNKLPVKYTDKAKWDNIPKALSAVENTLRTLVFLLPVIMIFNLNSDRAIMGLIIYCLGIIFYFISWVVQMVRPDSAWSKSLLGTMAPAYTPIIWLNGIALIGKENFLEIPNFALFYFIISLVFVIVHSLHAYLAYKQNTEV